MKTTIELKSFCLGGAAVAALVTAARLPVPALIPFGDPGGPLDRTLLAVVLIAASAAAALAAVVVRRRVPPVVRVRSPLDLPAHAAPLPMPPDMKKWLESVRVDPASVASAQDLAQAEERIVEGLVRQFDESHAPLAEAIALLFCHLDRADAKSHEALIAGIAETAWRDISDRKRVCLSPMIAEMRIGAHLVKADREHSVLAAKHSHAVSRMVAAIVRYSRGRPFHPSSLLWLRAADPVLWHVVNNIGRQTFFVEGLGPMAHYQAELAAKAALPVPAVKAAAMAVTDALIASGEIRTEGFTR